METTFMRILAVTPLLMALLSGCATQAPEPNYVNDNLTLFAYELGATHASLAQCPALTAPRLSAHMETATLALQAQAGNRRNVWPAFQQGLHHPEGKPAALKVDCSCADALLTESRRHNLTLYRSVALPRAFRNSATQP